VRTAQQLVEEYEEGKTTATGLMLDLLNLTSKRAVAEALDVLPLQVLRELRAFVAHYSPRTRIFRGPRPRPQNVRLVKDWFAKPNRPRTRRSVAPSCHPSEGHVIRTLPVGDNPAFRELQEYANSVLAAKGYKLLEKRGSGSWTDSLVKPVDSAVRFKLCNCARGFFFGAREEWASVLGVPFAKLGNQSLAFSPSAVLFRGGFLTNTPEGREYITRVVELFPPAGSTSR
jgi:hypothetical protein